MKKLKKFKKKETNLDDELIPTFQEFYSKLYADHHPTMDSLTKEALVEAADSLADNSSENPNELLNSPFIPEELSTAISGLKNGKASSFDHISNEMIKALSLSLKMLSFFSSTLASLPVATFGVKVSSPRFTRKDVLPTPTTTGL